MMSFEYTFFSFNLLNVMNPTILAKESRLTFPIPSTARTESSVTQVCPHETSLQKGTA